MSGLIRCDQDLYLIRGLFESVLSISTRQIYKTSQLTRKHITRFRAFSFVPNPFVAFLIASTSAVGS